MKILLSADCFFPAPMGGPSNSIYWQAKALVQAGHDVTVIATSQDLPSSVPLNQWLAMDCGRVMYTRNPHFYLPLTHIWQGWRAIPKVDIVHVNSLFYPASLVWVLLSRLAGKPVIWSPHGELNPVALSIRPQIKNLMLALIKRIIDPTIQFQAASPTEAAHIRQCFGPATPVTDIQPRMALPQHIRPAETNRLTQPYVLFMGRLHPIKAIDNLIQALGTSTVFRTGNFLLVIAGPDVNRAYRQTLTELVHELKLSDKVMFIGPVQGEQKEALYANAYLTVLPSHAESFGNVVMESLAQGTPVVASTNAPWQVLETEQAGSWVSNELEPLRGAIEGYLLMPPDTYTGYRDRASSLAQRCFDIAENTGEWERLYQAAIGGNNQAKEVITAGS